MVINTNLSAQSSARLLMQSSAQLSQSLARLSSGSKINSPADDSAGLAVSMNLTAQMGRNTAANDNIGNAISFNQTQDGYLQQVSNALNRMSELAVQSQDVTKSDSDRSLYQQEFNTLANYISSVSTKDFNGVTLFDGSQLNVTIDSDANTFSMNGVDLTGTTFAGLANDSISSMATAPTALNDVKTATGQGSRRHRSKHGNADRLQQSALDVEQQPVGGQQPDHGRGRCAGEHQLRQIQHPRADRHGDAGAGKRAATIGPQTSGLIPWKNLVAAGGQTRTAARSSGPSAST